MVKNLCRWSIFLAMIIHDPNVTRDHQRQALAKLQDVRGHLLHARLAALDAQLWLVGARVSGGEGAIDLRVRRAAQLCKRVTNAIVHTERLLFFVQGDTALEEI
jgi:hypothetical protein